VSKTHQRFIRHSNYTLHAHAHDILRAECRHLSG
jgi:hypothetical protein